MSAEETVAAPPETVPHLGFFLGDEMYGVPLTRLREVCKLTRLRRVPGAAPHVAGLVNVRGEIVCALNVRAILGLLPSPPPAPEPAYLIALRDFEYPVGIVVDAIADIFAIDPATIVAPPESWPADRARCFVGTTTIASGAIGLLNVDGMVTR
jgi:purine-binding chemotaxis protein CheW